MPSGGVVSRRADAPPTGRPGSAMAERGHLGITPFSRQPGHLGVHVSPSFVKPLYSSSNCILCGAGSQVERFLGLELALGPPVCPLPPTGPLISKVLATSGDLVSGPLPIAGARCASGGLLGLKASVLTGVGVCFTLDALSQIIPIN